MVNKDKARIILPRIYQLIRVLSKTSDKGSRKAWAAVARIREKHDGDFEAVFTGWWADIRSDLESLDADTEAGFLKGIKDAFDTDSLLKSYRPVLMDFVASYQDAAEKHLDTVKIGIDWSVTNDKAVTSVADAVDIYFSNFADDQRGRIQDILESGLADGTPTRDIAKSLAEGMDNVVYTDEDGNITRTLSPEQWGEMVARTESNRAYVDSVRESLLSADLLTWECIVADDERTCEDCASNDGAIVNIGDDLPSGDAEPPIHSNCRCTMVAVTSEIDGSSANTDSEE